MGHQHMLNSTQLSVGLGHRHDLQELWPAGLGHRHKPRKHSTLHATQTQPHTSRSPPERHPCSIQTSAATTCNLLFFLFSLFEKEAKERRGRNSLSQLSDECRTTTPENARCRLQEGHDAGSAVDNDPRRVGFSSAFSKDSEG